MSKPIYVYSTLSNDQNYTTYANGGEIPQAESAVYINGKANVADKRFLTPRGVVTKITPEQLAELKANPLFQMHEKNGFVTYSEAKSDADEVASDLVGRDQSAPLVEEDFEDEAKDREPSAPVSNKRKSR